MRPTIRCLREDLRLTLPPANQPLDTVDHIIVRKANAVFTSSRGDGGERIVSIDDRVLFKVKVQRWRGAVWRALPEQWLCAAGWREEGSPDDFYEELASRCRGWRRERNRAHTPALTTDTFSDPLLPTDLDRNRLKLEEAEARVRAFEITVGRLVRESLRTSLEQYSEVAGFGIGILVERRDIAEVYVGVRIQGPVSTKDYAIILGEVPGTDPTGWFIDSMPHREDQPGEVVWSNVMDQEIAVSLLNE